MVNTHSVADTMVVIRKCLCDASETDCSDGKSKNDFLHIKSFDRERDRHPNKVALRFAEEKIRRLQNARKAAQGCKG
jgi:hypothetical protein